MTDKLQNNLLSSLKFPKKLVTNLATKLTIVLLSAELASGTVYVTAKNTTTTISKSETAIAYDQQSKVLGRCQLLVSKAGIRLDWFNKNVALISHPPEWRMTMLNTAEKKYFTSAPGRFRACSNMTVTMCRTSDTSVLKPRSSQKTILSGRNVNKIAMIGEPSLKAGDRNWQKMLLHSADYWVESTPFIPPLVVQYIQEMYVIPAADGIPLQLFTVSNKQKIEKELILLSAKTQTVSNKEFAIPENYKPVKAQENLITDSNSADVLQLIPQP